MRSMIPFRGWLRRLWRCRRGVAAVEFAIALPILVVLLIGGAEYTRYCVANQKLERVTASVADLTSQAQSLSLAELQTIFGVVDTMLRPFSIDESGKVIVSSVSGQGSKAVVKWQESYGGSGDQTKVGAKGATATLPSGLTLRDGENVIVCETFMLFEPMFVSDLINEARLYRVAAFRPRFGSLEQDPRGG